MTNHSRQLLLLIGSISILCFAFAIWEKNIPARPPSSKIPALGAPNIQTPAYPSPYANALPNNSAPLIGKWSRTELTGQTVTYNPDKTTDVYLNGKLTDHFKWEITNGIIEEFDPTGHNRFYKIEKLDQQNLQLLYTATGKTLNYTRAE